MKYFNTFKSIRIEIEPCNNRNGDDQDCDEETVLNDFWRDTAAAVHVLSNDIDLTDYRN